MTEIYNPRIHDHPTKTDENGKPLKIDAVDHYLFGMAEGNIVAGELLITALKKDLAQRQTSLVPLPELPVSDDIPTNIRSKWGEVAFKQFDPDADRRIHGPVAHVADWLNAAVINHMAQSDPAATAWLDDKDDKGRPKKLLKLSMLEQAVAEADKAMATNTMKMRQKYGKYERPLDLDNHISLVQKFDENYCMVRIQDAEGLDIESSKLGHCVGEGAYDAGVKSGQTLIYSLRDANNTPYATLEVQAADKLLLQCRGRDNEFPALEHMRYAARFAQEKNLDVMQYLEETNMMQDVNGCFDIRDMPPEVSLTTSLYMGYNFPMPEKLKVAGTVYISDPYFDISQLKRIDAENIHFKSLELEDVTERYDLPDNCEVEESISFNGEFYDPKDALNVSAVNISYSWYDKDKRLHRQDGPADITIDGYDGEVTESWYVNGKDIQPSKQQQDDWRKRQPDYSVHFQT